MGKADGRRSQRFPQAIERAVVLDRAGQPRAPSTAHRHAHARLAAGGGAACGAPSPCSANAAAERAALRRAGAALARPSIAAAAGRRRRTGASTATGTGRACWTRGGPRRATLRGRGHAACCTLASRHARRPVACLPRGCASVRRSACSRVRIRFNGYVTLIATVDDDMPQPRSTATPGSTLRAAQSGVAQATAQYPVQYPVLRAVPGVCVLYVVLSTDESSH